MFIYYLHFILLKTRNIRQGCYNGLERYPLSCGSR